jgi:prophage antirepressor-like protein
MARQPRHQLSCQCCGLLFPAINLSAKWCSNACRQWAYHERKRTAALVEPEPAAAALAPFAYQGRQVRVVTDEHGNPWFVAADLLAVLSLDRKAMERLDDDERGVSSIHTPGGRQSMTTVNEFGLYSLILGSRKPEARQFKRWVTHEVLPAIRKTGSYGMSRSQPQRQRLPHGVHVIADNPRHAAWLWATAVEAEVSAALTRSTIAGRHLHPAPTHYQLHLLRA